MKKIVAIAALMLGLTVVGCDNKKKPEATAPQAELTPPAPQPYIPPSAASTTTPMSDPIVTPVPEAKHSSKASAKATVAPAPKKAAVAKTGAIKPGSTYIVKKGDTLSEIAKAAYGSGSKKNMEKIKKANKLKSDVVKLGQKLKIPA